MLLQYHKWEKNQPKPPNHVGTLFIKNAYNNILEMELIFHT